MKTTGNKMKLLFIFLLASLAGTAFAAEYNIHWVLAHQPARVFERAAKHFAAEVEQKSNGKIKVTILGLTPDGLGQELNPHEAFGKVQSGEVEMCQTYTTYLGHQNKEMWVLDLPYLFKGHEHASRVLDGEIGKSLLVGLESKGVKGLGFTYSGGYRIIPSEKKAIVEPGDFKNLKIKVVDSPVARSYMKELGAKPIYIEDNNHYAKGVEAFETTFARLPAVKGDSSKYINVTEHSLFLTAIIMNKKFYDQLPADLQKIVQDAVLSTAKLEREDSIKDNIEQRKKYEVGNEIKVLGISPELKKFMTDTALKIHKKYEKYFSGNIIEKIKSN